MIVLHTQYRCGMELPGLKSRYGKSCWSLWRHCCCRYGKIPVPIMLFTSCGTILTLLTTFSCNFLKVDIGFEPSNNEWGEETLHVGPWYYRIGANEVSTDAEGLNSFIDGFRRDSCSGYTNELKASFIDSDSVWQFARVSLLIGAISAIVATVRSLSNVEYDISSCWAFAILIPSIALLILTSSR